MGIEPTSEGFADLSLTTWVPRPDAQYSESRIVFQRRISGKDAGMEMMCKSHSNKAHTGKSAGAGIRRCRRQSAWTAIKASLFQGQTRERKFKTCAPPSSIDNTAAVA